jgi:catecholate siderophore receptor
MAKVRAGKSYPTVIMKLSNLISRRLALPACVVFSVASNAQTVPVTPPVENDFDQVVELSKFVVSTTSDRGYASTNSLTATRADVALRDVPNAIIVLNEEFLKDRQMFNLRDVLLYAPGVSNVNAADDGDRVRLRGLTMTVPQLDGFRTPGTRSQETADVERVELLKGSAGLLYGNTFNFGGLINRVTVTPSFRPHSTLQFRYGSNDYKEALFDFGGAVGDSKTLAHRTYFKVLESDGLQDGTELRRDSVINHLLWKVNDKLTISTRVLALNQFVRDYRARDFFVNGVLVEQPREYDFYDGLRTNDTVFGYVRVFADYKINDQWSARASVVQATSRSKTGDIVNENVVGTELTRTLRTFDGVNTNTFGRLDFLGKFETGPAEHSLLIGIEDAYDNNPSFQYDNALPRIDLVNPVFGNVARGPRTNVQRLHSITQIAAGYVQEQAFFFKKRLSLVGGLRYDKFQFINRPTDTVANRLEVKGNETTKRAGMVVRPIDNTSLYASYSEGFNPRTFLNRDFSYIPPATGETKEVGIKTEFLQGRLRFDADYFVQTLGAILGDDPNNPSGAQLVTGEQEYKGYEAGLTMGLTDNWQLIAGYGNTTATIKSDPNPANNGLNIINFPEHTANLWTKYKWGGKSASDPLWYVGAGLNYSSVYYTDNFKTREIPSYTRYDVAVGAVVGRFTIDVRIDNVANKRFWDAGANGWLNVNAPRQATLSVKYKF